MAELCASIVSPKRGNLKPSARCGKDWGSSPLHTMCQSHLSLRQINVVYLQSIYHFLSSIRDFRQLNVICTVMKTTCSIYVYCIQCWFRQDFIVKNDLNSLLSIYIIYVSMVQTKHYSRISMARCPLFNPQNKQIDRTVIAKSLP